MTKFQFQALPRWVRDFIPLIFWMTLIFVLSSQSTLIDMGTETRRRLFYKPVHMITYALLAWFWWRALAPRRHITWWVLSLALGLTALYGISDEIHQLFVPGRVGQIADVLFDTGGALAMILLLRRSIWLRHFPENLSIATGMGVEHQSNSVD